MKRRVSILVLLLFLVGSFLFWKSEVWVPWVYEIDYCTEDYYCSRVIDEMLGEPNPFRFLRGRIRGRRMRSRVPWLLVDRTHFYYHDERGFKACERIGERTTGWDAHGKIRKQESWSPELLLLRERHSSPWWWGESDQEAPDPPDWLYDDSLFDESQR